MTDGYFIGQRFNVNSGSNRISVPGSLASMPSWRSGSGKALARLLVQIPATDMRGYNPFPPRPGHDGKN